MTWGKAARRLRSSDRPIAPGFFPYPCGLESVAHPAPQVSCTASQIWRLRSDFRNGCEGSPAFSTNVASTTQQRRRRKTRSLAGLEVASCALAVQRALGNAWGPSDGVIHCSFVVTCFRASAKCMGAELCLHGVERSGRLAARRMATRSGAVLD